MGLESFLYNSIANHFMNFKLKFSVLIFLAYAASTVLSLQLLFSNILYWL